MTAEVLERLERIEQTLKLLADKQTVKEHYSTSELSVLVGRSEFTVREWARLGRLNAKKQKSGRGEHFSWVISNDEFLRYQRDGLLPLRAG